MRDLTPGARGAPPFDDAPSAVRDRVAIVTPALNEGDEIDAFARGIAALDPPPDEVILVDGGSDDDTVPRAQAAGFTVINGARRGRAAQINEGVQHASAPLIMVLHADSAPPADAIAIVAETLRDAKTSLAGFTPVIAGPQGVRRLSTFHNLIKTWYAPAIFRPLTFLRGGRLLFGDHAMFFRRDDFLAVGGCDPTLMVMEDAEMCLKLAKIGRVRLMRAKTITSDRRIARWGGLRANMTYFLVGFLWAIGFRHAASRFYPDIRQ